MLNLILGVVGAALFALAALHLVAAFREEVHPSGSGTSVGFSVALPLHWLAVAAIGAGVCFLSIWLSRRKA